MRVAFLLAILLASCIYTYWSFADLAFLSSAGRLGPGFFPRLIGLGLIAFCLLSLWPDIRQRATDDTRSRFWGVTALIAALTGLFVFALNVLGGALAMAAFLIVSLSLLNRGKHIQNVAIAVFLPAAIFALFDRWLNASMPEGILPLPI